jgi:hypothetical protein
VRLCTGNLHHHLEVNNVEYLQFAFRWMNNLLMREVPLHCVVRLWDTYLVSCHFIVTLVIFCYERLKCECAFSFIHSVCLLFVNEMKNS